MSASEAAGNLLAYSLQVAAVAGAGLLAPAVLRLRTPRALHAFYEAVLVACLALPLVQPWRVRTLPAASQTAFRMAATTEAGAVPGAWWSASEWVLAVYGAGLAGRLAWLALGLCRLRALRRKAAELVSVPRAIETACESTGTTARFFVSRDSGGPATCGLFRPVVLLPGAFLELRPELQEAVVRHELLHVARRDWATTLCEEAIRALFWFHPVVWRLIGRIRLTREQVVDRLAAGGGRSRKAYLEALVAVASGAERCPSPAPAFAGECHLAKRISLLLKEVPMSKSHLVLSLFIAAAAAGSAGVAAALCFPLDVTESQAKKPQPAGDRVYKAGGGVVAPKLISKVEPKYSEEAREAKVQGRVVLGVVIDAKGRPENVKVVKGLEPSLDAKAVEAVKQWKFQPGARQGKPVRVQATIEVNFRLM
jgi:TonB family protein